MKGHALIGGGTGFVGQSLCKLLANKGFDITVVSRAPKCGQISWKDIERSGLPSQVTHVVNLAGQNILDVKHRWTEDFKKLVWNSRVGTIDLLKRSIVAASDQVKAFVIMSGVSIYKPAAGVEYGEESKTEEYDFLSRMCVEMEDAARMPTEIACRRVIIRSGIILGRGGGMIKNLYLPFSFGLGGPIMPGSQYLPWIHIDDTCRLILHALENDQVSGVLNGVAPQHATNEEFTKAFARALRRPAIIPLPEFVLKFLYQERSMMMTTGQLVKPKRPLALGFQYVYPDIVSACNDLVNPAKKPL